MKEAELCVKVAELAKGDRDRRGLDSVKVTKTV
jgi:hypothetical protein